MKNVLLLLVLIGLVACQAAFQPVPDYYQLWSKSGATQLDVTRALLECGSPSPAPWDADFPTLNDYVLVRLCMEKINYKYNEPFRSAGGSHTCNRHPNLPACQPGAEIPDPSVERRLNSKYCRSNLDKEYCYTVYGKAICNRTFENAIKYRITYLECKP